MLYPLVERQVMIRTSAAITQTALVGRHAAVISPAPNAIGAAQDLHLLIFITLYILRILARDVTDVLKMRRIADIMSISVEIAAALKSFAMTIYIR